MDGWRDQSIKVNHNGVRKVNTQNGMCVTVLIYRCSITHTHTCAHTPFLA